MAIWGTPNHGTPSDHSYSIKAGASSIGPWSKGFNGMPALVPVHTLWQLNIALEHGAFIVDLPMKDGDFRSYVAVYQRVDWWGSSFQNLFPQGASTFPEKNKQKTKTMHCGHLWSKVVVLFAWQLHETNWNRITKPRETPIRIPVYP